MTAFTGAPASGVAAGADGPVWHTLNADRVLQAEKVDEQSGLSSAEAASRAERFGPNKFDAGTVEPRWRAFLRQYTDLMQIVLLAAGLVSLLLQEWETGIVLLVLTLFNAVLGLQQEGKAAAAVAALQKMMIIKARVTRDGQLQEIPAEQLVPGDIVALEAGDVVPADGRLLLAVVTAILAAGTQALARAGAIMKRLQSTETLGSTSAINSDKTGTLTLNQMTAVQMAVVGRRYTIEGKGYSADGQITRVAGEAEIPMDQFLMPMVLASDAVLSDGEMIGDPTEGALVALAAKGGVDATQTRQAYPRIAELPFDTAYKLMATFHKMTDESGQEMIRCFVKGAPDQLLARAATVLDADTGPAPADGRFRELYQAENQRLGEQGLRVMATARKDFDPAAFDPGADLLPLVTGLELLALVGIVDPPRPAAKASIATAEKAGIRVRMITGDHAVTASAIARQLDIDGTVITGAEFGAMSDDEALSKIDDIGVIARVTPEHKVRLVDVLKRQGHIVAMTGDGVNDAPALKRADIGIAMGITGTEVTKEAAVMVLTDDNFSTIVKAVELGRGLYDNLVKYVRFQMGCLFGFIISFLGAAIFDIAGGVPFLPLQTLWINFTTLLFQAIGLGYGTPAAGLMERKPRQSDQPILTRGRFAWLASVGLVMGVGTLGVISWAEQVRTQEIAHTMGVVTFSLYALFFSITTKDERRTMFSLDTFSDSKFVIATGVSVLTLLLTTVFGPLQAFLNTTSLDVRQWSVCLAVALSIVVVSEIRTAVRRHTAPGHQLTR